MSRYKELGTPRSEFYGICRKAWAGPDMVFLKVGPWLIARGLGFTLSDLYVQANCLMPIPGFLHYVFQEFLPWGDINKSTPLFISSQDKPKYNSTWETNELSGLDYKVWLRGCCQEHGVLQAATLGNLHPAWMAAPRRPRDGAPSVTLSQIISSSTSWRWWGHVQLGQNCIPVCGSRGWSFSEVQWSSPPLLPEGMPAVTGPLKMMFCKQAPLSSDGDSYSTLNPCPILQHNMLCQGDSVLPALSVHAGIKASVPPAGDVLPKLFQVSAGEINCTLNDCTGKDPGSCHLDFPQVLSHCLFPSLILCSPEAVSSSRGIDVYRGPSEFS